MRKLCFGTLWIAMGAALCRCAPESPGPGGAGRLADDPSAIKGELVTYVADFEDGHSERWHALRLPGGQETRLQFDAPPLAKSGVTLRVRGEPLGPSLHVSDFEVVEAEALPPDSSPDVYATPATDTYALVLVDLGSGPPTTTAAQGQTTMFSATPTDKSFAQYYSESSYGKYTITGDVVGPVTYAMTTCDTSGMGTALAPMFPGYNHLIYYFPHTSLCTFGGLGEEGSSARPAKQTWMNGSVSCVVLMQEPGHNLGLMHANTIKCGTSTFTTNPATDCTITEYGSQLTTMGGGCRTLNAYERWYMQWLTGCNGVRVPGNGTFNLVPLETSCPTGTQVLQVPFPATLAVSDPQSTSTTVNLKNYYLELRVAGGSFDTYTTSGSRGGGSSLSFAGPTVFLYTSDDVRVPTTTGRGGGQNSVWTELLNTTPSGTPFTGLSAAGQSFTDPAGGPTITLQAISATGATITVTNAMGTGAGTATCIDGSAFVEPGPASCGPTGAGGTTGAAGTSGGAGTSGAVGTTGAAGAAGRNGTTGAAGTTGAGGRGGAAGGTTTGSAGAGLGTGGAPAGTAGTGAIPHEGAVTGGCACGVGDGGGAGANPAGMGVAFVTLGLALGRRRHGRWRRRRSS